MKNNYIHRILAFLIALLVLFPFMIQATHALEKHEHKVCNAKDVKHIHQEEVDCSVFHTTIDNNALLLSDTINSLKKENYFECFSITQQLNSFDLFTLKSPRAPPYFS